MQEANAQTLQERKKLFTDAVKGIKPKRVPLLSHVWTYKIFDAGYTLNEALHDYDKLANAMYKFHEKYNFDTYIDIGGRNPVKVVENFDAEIYNIDDERDILTYVDSDCMEAPDDLVAMAEKGMLKFTYENILPEKYKVKNPEDAITRMVNAGEELLKFTQAFGKIQNTLIDDYGVPQLAKGRYDVPCEVTFSGGLRGIKSFSMDMRRYPEKLLDMFEVMDKTTVTTFQDALDTYANDDRMIFPVRLTCLAHTIMNAKQFEKFYWPALKYFTDKLVEHDYQGFIFVEGSINHVYEFFQELPKDRIALLFEQDDPKTIKEKLPNVTLTGGYPTDVLKSGTVEQCIDKAKELLEIMAYDGRWIYSSSKMISYKNDVNPENLLAVNNWLRENAIF